MLMTLSQDYNLCLISDFYRFFTAKLQFYYITVTEDVPVAPLVNLKESYDNMKILGTLHYKYNTYKWQICDDLKVIAMQRGFTKYCFFLYM